MYWPVGAPRVYAADTHGKYPPGDSEKGEPSDQKVQRDDAILGLETSRTGHILATVTTTTLNIWYTFPVILVASAVRSPSSLKNYGYNVDVLLRPDSAVAIVQTSLSYFITYNIIVDPESRVFQQLREDDKTRRSSTEERLLIEEARIGQREVHIQFRMMVKIDAGISKALAIDDAIVVATEKPAAMQYIRWTSDSRENQTSTDLLYRLEWLNRKSKVMHMAFDRALGLFVWITSDGRAYAVQRNTEKPQDNHVKKAHFHGHSLHTPKDDGTFAIRAAINARFSLLAVGCANNEVHVYTARDYAGNLPLSYKLVAPASLSTTGLITFMAYSPDGCCLFIGYEQGWVMWSVCGKLGANSFAADRPISEANDERWLTGIFNGCWLGTGSTILLSAPKDDRLFVLEIARSAVAGYHCPANVSQTLLHTCSSLFLHGGNHMANDAALVADNSLWSQVQIPTAFVANQYPIRSAVISFDGRYIAVAGRRGLAHYSVHSGRWKTFDDPVAEDSFVVRGGMCWHQHVLIAAVDTEEQEEIRLYSREHKLDDSSLLFTEVLSSPIVTISTTGEDSLLVYTYENYLYHYIIRASNQSIELVKVGQIGLNGIIRAPARVRAISWFVPDHQLLDGDPSQDVVHASILFLVDAKLVLLQPSTDSEGALKYDMRIIANDVEFFHFARDQIPLRTRMSSPGSDEELDDNDHVPVGAGLQESLWYFDGRRMLCWPDFRELLRFTNVNDNKQSPKPISITIDFYPTNVALSKGIIVGLESDLVQRRDAAFAVFRYSSRTQLFLPSILRYHLENSDSSSALGLSHHYRKLSYFPHALEILLHNVLDDEVDAPLPEGKALLPSVISFLSSFPEYLDIIVQCTRKTEVRSWRTLFTHLPPPRDLFEEALGKGLLKTAGGYLIVMHTLEELDSSAEHCVRLLQMATQAGDWDLCKELARFLMALDESGETLRQAIKRIDLDQMTATRANGHSQWKIHPKLPHRRSASAITHNQGTFHGPSRHSRSQSGSPVSISSRTLDGDYFSERRR